MFIDQITLDTRLGSQSVRDLIIAGDNSRRIAARLQMEGARNEHCEIVDHIEQLRNCHSNQSATAKVIAA